MQYPKAIGPYSPFREAGNLVFFSGQIPLVPDTGEVPSNLQDQVHQAMRNVGGVLEAAGLNYSSVIKTTVFLADIDDFAAVNEIYAQYFKEPFPARSAVAVKDLPKGVKLEVEVIAHK